jgi:hypothetical protein
VKRTRWLIAGLTLALVLSLAYNARLWSMMWNYDQIAEDLSAESQHRAETISALRWMADRYGRLPARSEVEGHMKVRFPEPDHVVKWEGDTLWVDEVGLQYRGDSATAIVLMNEVK